MTKVSITIDGKRIVAGEGEKLLWVALDNGIYIPNLCAIHDKPEPDASCRLCFVEIEGREQPVTACTETVSDGMVVNTRGKNALSLARSGFELLLASHPVDCGNCAASGRCELQKLARHLGVKLNTKRYRKLLRELPVDDSHPLISYDPNKCVLCGRCIWACRKKGILGFARRGFQRVVTTFASEPLGTAGCQDCKECVSVCPTGAMIFKQSSMRLSENIQ